MSTWSQVAGALPLVSITVPTYNRAALVTKAIDSLLVQTYPNIEVIVVDDGSTDATAETLGRYASDPRVRVVRHEQNRGVTAAKNTGIDAMNGVYGGILDSDDELLPGAVGTLLSTFESLGPDVGVVFADCVDPMTGVRTGQGVEASGYVSFRDVVTGRVQGEFWGMWRQVALGDRRFDTSLPGGSESLVWHDLYRRNRVYYVRETVRKYSRRSGDSVTRANVEPARLERTRRMYERYLDLFGEDMLRYDAAAYAKQLQLVSLWHLLAGERRRGIARLLESIRIAPAPMSAARALAMAVTPAFVLRKIFDWRYERSLSRGSRG